MDCSHLFRRRPGPCNESVFLTIGGPDVKSGASPNIGWRGIRTERYTYAWARGNERPWILYDNEKDPYQMHNLVKDPGYQPLLKSMNERLVKQLKDTGDSWAELVAGTTL